MIATLATLVNIMAYLIAPPAGFATVALTLVVVASRRARSRLEKLLTMLLLTLPLYMVPLLPGLHHFISWTTILLLGLTAVSISRLRRLSPLTLFLMLVIVSFSVLTGLSTDDGSEGWYYLAQFLLLVIPPALFYESRDWVASTLDAEAVSRLFSILVFTLLATALGVIAQWQLHSRTGMIVGNISFFLQRVTYDLTVPAYSVLSGLLALGIAIAPTLWRRGRRTMSIVLATVSAFAIVVNSSRTGLVVGLLVVGLSLLFPPRGARRFVARLALIPVGVLGWWLFDYFSTAANRGSAMQVLLDDNGRFNTFDRAFELLFSGDDTVLTGVGYANYPGTPPHNFAVETMASSGLVAAACVGMLAIGLLWYLRGTEWQYAVWSLLAASMFFSGFYAVKAAVVVAIAMIAFRAAEDKHEEPLRRSAARASASGASVS
ncbi:hypothetical protein PQI51_03115 [Microbacterium esteraromaticum]|uniref:hypothetical protein n=1 Tax=Microbacterium esteraromaticum TaxID=57043 RepID=UPI0030A88EF1